MLICRMHTPRSRISPASMLSCLGLALLIAPCRHIDAQGDAGRSPAEWTAWAFGRVGAARTGQIDGHGRPDAVLGSLGGGIGASRGAMLGIVRSSVTFPGSFEDSPPVGVQDYAVLAVYVRTVNAFGSPAPRASRTRGKTAAGPVPDRYGATHDSVSRTTCLPTRTIASEACPSRSPAWLGQRA
jgi:hypothetical protein